MSDSTDLTAECVTIPVRLSDDQHARLREWAVARDMTAEEALHAMLDAMVRLHELG